MEDSAIGVDVSIVQCDYRFMTTYKKDGRNYEIKREAVVREIASAERDARNNIDRNPTRGEYELGATRSDLYAYAVARRAEAARLTKVLACVDAGAAELPAELCP